MCSVVPVFSLLEFCPLERLRAGSCLGNTVYQAVHLFKVGDGDVLVLVKTSRDLTDENSIS